MQQHIVIHNLLLNYSRVAGQVGANAKTLLFLHGWRSEGSVWNSTISALEKQGLNAYAIDFPGFGHSAISREAYTIKDFSQTIAEFINKLELHNVQVVGHSFGGRVGIKLAASYPGLVEKLVLVDSAGFASDKNKKSLLAFAAKIVKPLFKPQIMQGLRKSIYRYMGAEDYVETPELQATFVNVINEDLTEDMKKIQAPTLIISGANDKDIPISFGEKMHSLIPHSKFVILNSAGHFSFLDNPQEFKVQLENFLK